jgi:hypothetical protein
MALYIIEGLCVFAMYVANRWGMGMSSVDSAIMPALILGFYVLAELIQIREALNKKC